MEMLRKFLWLARESHQVLHEVWSLLNIEQYRLGPVIPECKSKSKLYKILIFEYEFPFLPGRQAIGVLFEVGRNRDAHVFLPSQVLDHGAWDIAGAQD